MTIDRETPVLVVGAGLAGLSAAMFLGLHGVPAVVLERHPTTSVHPKARGQFPQVMEVLRLAGVDERFRAASPPDNDFSIIIAASAAGPVFHRILVGPGPDLSALSTAGWADVSQERGEPILADRARELGAEIRFNTELESFTQDADGITATVVDLTTGERGTIRARYLVGADGHRSPIRAALGIGEHGRGVLGTGIGTVFEADLSAVLDGRALIHLRNPELPGGGGALVSTDQPNRHAISIGFDGERPTDERWIEIIRVATGIPDLDPVLVPLGQGTTDVKHWVADRFGAGRVHLIGDAVRVMPPTGAFGGNTAIMDGFYLAWKLAMVVRGQAGAELLATHEPERRPYSEIIAEQQYTAFTQRSRPELANDTVAAPIEPVSTLFFGYRHISPGVLLEPGDTGEPLENPELPTGRPGSRAPHILERRDGTEKSIVELFGRGWVLLTATPSWAEAAGKVGAALGVDLPVELVTEPDWAPAYGVTEAGAVLVRPDFFVAWRSVGADRPEALERALRSVLFR